MKFRFCLRLAVLTVGLAMLSTITQAEDLEADKAKLLALENSWNLAQLQRDSKALQSLVSDQYVYTDYDGTVMNKAQFLADNRDPSYKPTLVANEDMQVMTYANVAIVIGKYHAKGTYRDKVFDHWGRFTDTWVYENNGWRCIATHTSLLSAE
jgi:ketosteroid isomerase-like protein